jgi:hypothetical protein
MQLPGAIWSRPQPTVDTAFIARAVAWMRASEEAILKYVWGGYDRLLHDRSAFDCNDLERSITEHLERSIADEMSSFEPYVVQHGPYERETMQRPPAQPPQYDIAFVFRADPRVMWPLEAKILPSPRALAAYIRDVRQEYLTCRYAPFSPSGAMVGYLLQGTESDTLIEIETRLGCPLASVPAFANRPCAVSNHARQVPIGKPYPANFDCHHLIMTFYGVRRGIGKNK